MKLVFPNGEHPQVVLNTGINRIGSARDGAVVLERPGIAPVHCEIHQSGIGVNLQVPAGAPPVMVNDKPVREMIALRAGDTINLGGVIARVAAMDAPRAVPASGTTGTIPSADDDSGATRMRAAVPKFVLRGVSGPVFGKMYPVAGPTVIGRAPECAIAVTVDEISRRHVELKPVADGVSVEDLGSANGTYVNGQRVQKGYMKAGDELRLDAVRFMLVAPGQEVAATRKVEATTAATTGKSGGNGKLIGGVVALVAIAAVAAWFLMQH
ncbi:MAG TPA: FHA domain-containing protein [Xanthomonadaceae bacterium]|jgi:pSer/pThr/pTyr-binding forkhead associated (FHA) protein